MMSRWGHFDAWDEICAMEHASAPHVCYLTGVFSSPNCGPAVSFGTFNGCFSRIELPLVGMFVGWSVD